MIEELRTYKDNIGVDSEKINIMIAALQRQTPMKIKDYTDVWFICPNCGERVEDFDNEFEMWHFCPYCGQAVEWRDD